MRGARRLPIENHPAKPEKYSSRGIRATTRPLRGRPARPALGAPGSAPGVHENSLANQQVERNPLGSAPSEKVTAVRQPAHSGKERAADTAQKTGAVHRAGDHRMRLACPACPHSATPPACPALGTGRRLLAAAERPPALPNEAAVADGRRDRICAMQHLHRASATAVGSKAQGECRARDRATRVPASRPIWACTESGHAFGTAFHRDFTPARA